MCRSARRGFAGRWLSDHKTPQGNSLAISGSYRGQAVRDRNVQSRLNLPDVGLAGISAVFAGSGIRKNYLHANRVDDKVGFGPAFPTFISAASRSRLCFLPRDCHFPSCFSVGDTLRTFSRPAVFTRTNVTIDKLNPRILAGYYATAFSLSVPYVHLCYTTRRFCVRLSHRGRWH